MRSTEPPSYNDRLIQRYLDFLRLERRYSEHSVLAVRRDLSFIEGSLADVSATTLKTVLVKRHAGGSAPSSLARMASSWRGFFGFLLDSGQIEINPALSLKTPKLPRALPKAVGVDQLAALLHGPLLEQYRLAQAHVLIELLYCTGLRISEALSLTDAVLANLTELRVQGKGSKTRIVPVIDALRERFAEFSHLRTKHLVHAGNPSINALFVSAKGLPLSVRQAQKDVSEFSKLRVWINTCIPTCCGTHLVATCCKAPRTCAQCRNCWGMHRSHPRRFTRRLILITCPVFMTKPFREPNKVRHP